jgi:hypothetical protein
MAYTPAKHGRAEYGSWMQVSNTLATALPTVEGDDSVDLKNQKFANLVYIVNPADVGGGSGSGGISDIQLAQLTSAISTQTTSLSGKIDDVNSQLITLDSDLTSAISAQTTTLSGKIDSTNTALATLDTDIKATTTAVDAQTTTLSGKIDSTNTALATLDADVKATTTAVSTLDSNMASAITSQTSSLSPSLTELLIDNTYSRIIQTISTDTYIAQAPRGSSTSASVWRVQKIDVNGSRSWAGTGIFNQPADNVASLSYAY